MYPICSYRLQRYIFFLTYSMHLRNISYLNFRYFALNLTNKALEKGGFVNKTVKISPNNAKT